ncbi:hypothetical protein WJX72_010140 [[Myrmecia] bisecta]|uniref:CS domain-containing protein n=1 Tax=[Myrmecia] bisecta TaxID=41462 RepID=A0AAW1QG92_9CHLO
MSTKTSAPPVKWSQRKDVVYLSIDVQDAEQPQVKLDSDDKHGKVSFKGKAKSHATGPELHEYSLDLELNGPIDPKQSKISVSGRQVLLCLKKTQEGHWPRLLAQSGKTPANITVDWDRWVDEDEEDEVKGKEPDLAGMQDFSNFDTSQFDVTGDNEDSDDEDLPGLES